MKRINEKGISPVVTTVLLILVSISAVIVIAGIIVPYVRSLLGESKECFATLEQLSINTESGYTCYYKDGGDKIATITIERGTKDIDITGFLIRISGGGIGKRFEVKEGQNPDSVVMRHDSSSQLEIPGLGEEITYNFTTTLDEIEYVEVAPIMGSGNTCEPTDKADIFMCP